MSTTGVSVQAICELQVGEHAYRIALPHADTDYIQGKINSERVPYELEMLKDMASRVAPGDLVLDIGANIGNHALYMAMAAACEVIAFEPNGQLCDALRESADLNSAGERLRVVHAALGATYGKGRLIGNQPENLGAQSVVVGDGEIEIAPLDSMHFDRPVKLIKIDVEGMELEVLRGATTLLERDRPLIYVECLDEKQFREVSDLLTRRGYSYWDTFNASPTHLFISSDELTVEQRLSRLQLATEAGKYRAVYQLGETRRKLDDANQKYRAASEQIVQVKTQLVELNSGKQVLEANLALVKERLDSANLKYRDVTAQSATLKTQLEEHRVALTAAQAKVDEAQDEVARRRAEVAQMANQLSANRQLADQAAQYSQTRLEDWQFWERETRARADMEFARLREDAVVMRAQLEQVHSKYHAAVANGHALQSNGLALEAKVERVQGERDQLAEQLHALYDERAQLVQQVDRLSLQFDEQAAVFSETESALKRECEERLADTVVLQAAMEERERELLRLERELATLFAHREENATELEEILHAHAEQVTALETIKLDREQQIVGLTADIMGLECGGAAHAEEIGHLRVEIGALTSEFNALKETCTFVENEAARDRSSLISNIELMNAERKAQTASFDQVKLEAIRHKLALTEANAQIERLRQQLVGANQQVLRTKNTLSFQLGHALIFGTKSFKEFRALPAKLWSIHQQAKQRRQERAVKGHKSASVKPAVTGPITSSPQYTKAAQMIADAARERLQGLHNNDGEQLARQLKMLKVAAIMDEFTHGSYKDECNLLQLTPAHWETELVSFKPDLLFIESAWRGKDELWGSKVGHMSQEVVGIVQWCREHKVPAVFWNKEDPVHFETFLSTAKLFDFVFTTDIDCIHRYKAALGHDRVYLLPFAAQPRVNNPIEKYERKDAFCFAGAYYARYPDRTRDLGNFVVNLPEFRPLEIYDRNYGKQDPNYCFPDEYQPFIVGNLPYAEIDKAYKGYRYAINLNSIKQSQSMFARRVYELLASNTITVSNYSRGVRLMFGDLVVTSDDGMEVRRRLEALGADDVNMRKLRLAALRKVMSEHTYQDRLAYVVAKVSAEEQPDLLPLILVTAYAKDQDQADRLIGSFERQEYKRKVMVLVVPAEFVPADIPSNGSVRVLSLAEADSLSLQALGTPSTWLSVMVPDDYYGPDYLTDLAMATRYSNAPVVGKTAHFVWSSTTGVVLRNESNAYSAVSSVPVRSGMSRLECLGSTRLREWIRGLYVARFEQNDVVSIDEFNYCLNGSRLTDSDRLVVNDLPDLAIGLPLHEMLSTAEAIAPEENSNIGIPQLSGKALAQLFNKPPKDSQVSLAERNGYLEVDSALADGKNEYWYATQDHEPAALFADQGKLKLHMETTPGLNLQIAVLFFDQNKQRIGHVVKTANRNHEIDLPANIAFVRLGLRIYAAGSARVQSLLLGHKSLEPAELLGEADHLVITNNYPSYGDLYRNGFVHSRVRSYRQRGIHSDVFRFQAEQAASYHEFEDVDVTTGGDAVLRKALDTGRYRTVFVHFFDEGMWRVLRDFVDRVKVVVWAHGSDIQAFHRREFLYSTSEQRTAAMKKGEERLAFWRDVLKSMPPSMHIVFVSQYLADTAMEDLGIRLSPRSYSVIHNPIDTERFAYVTKDAAQRKKILSIRPYASVVYANDLSVKAIIELSKQPVFNELEFRLIGDGPLFDETLEPLRGFKNVTIERRFLSQTEIASLHKEYGIFLCPTRMDTQGVSRDEAMASGLVPVTNRVAAIPEFVDGDCGMLAAGEDASGLAEGITTLVRDPKYFLAASANAAARVERQSGHQEIVERELALLAR